MGFLLQEMTTSLSELCVEIQKSHSLVAKCQGTHRSVTVCSVIAEETGIKVSIKHFHLPGFQSVTKSHLLLGQTAKFAGDAGLLSHF